MPGGSWLSLKDLTRAVGASTDQKVVETKHECLTIELPEGRADFEAILAGLEVKKAKVADSPK